MKILYAIQGTGNGHLARAIEIVPALKKRAQVDVLVSGTQADIDIPFPVQYHYKGLSFIFGKNGGIDYTQTLLRNNIFRLMAEIRSCPVKDYDLIISDFEPISSWACKFRGKKCIAMSHQSALLSPKVPKPAFEDKLGHFILKYYAPATHHYGFHFKSYDNHIFTPIIRKNIREANPIQKKHFTVYLPAYSDEQIIKVLSEIDKVKWHVFSKHTDKAYSIHNILVKPVDTKSFEKSIINCRGVICGAGFETPAESLFLEKRLMVIPMKGQHEQHYNAAALKKMGVPVINKLSRKHQLKIYKWTKSRRKVPIDFPDNTQNIVDQILSKYIIETEDVSHSFSMESKNI